MCKCSQLIHLFSSCNGRKLTNKSQVVRKKIKDREYLGIVKGGPKKNLTKHITQISASQATTII
jgi:hypothetical protein